MDEFQKLEHAVSKLLEVKIPAVKNYRGFVHRAYALAIKLRDAPYESKEEFREDLNQLCDLLSLELTK